jgi:hypothetical protein
LAKYSCDDRQCHKIEKKKKTWGDNHFLKLKKYILNFEIELKG